MANHVDEKSDQIILKALEDAPTSTIDLARLLNVTRPAVRKRLDRLASAKKVFSYRVSGRIIFWTSAPLVESESQLTLFNS